MKYDLINVVGGSFMNKLLIMVLARKYKNEIKLTRKPSHATIIEICMLIHGFTFGHYEHRFSTNLYKYHGGEYCELLQIIRHDIDSNINHPINQIHKLMLIMGDEI